MDAQLDPLPSVLVYLGFLLLALSLQLALALLTILAGGAEAILGRLADALERYRRPLLVVVGLVFATILLLEGLAGLGVR